MSSSAISDVPHYLKMFQTYLGPRIYVAFALTLLAGLSEGFGILMLLPLLRGVDGGDASVGEASEPATGVAKVMEDALGVFGWADSTVAVLLVITLAFVAKGALLFGANGYSAYLRGQLLRELKGRLFDCFSRMDYRYYVERDTGHFTNVINLQTAQALQSFTSLTTFVSQVVSTLVYFGLAFAVAWRFGLMALGLSVGLILLFRKLNRYVRGLSRKRAHENSQLAKLLIQFLQAFKYLTATGQARPLRNRVIQSVGALTGYEMRGGIAQAFTSALREPIAVVVIMLLVMVQLVFLQQPLAPIMVSILLFYRGLNSMMSVQVAWQSTLNHIGALEMVRDEFVDQDDHRELSGERPAPVLSEGITLEDVSFSYDGQAGEVISHVSMHLPVRSSVALVGESGAGKSTLVDILTLMLKPQSGQVLIDGVPGSEIDLASWRAQIGYVSQETVVFDDSIANNICMWAGNPEKDEALMARIREAAQRAHIAEHIESLPAGYQTMVGDRGVRLSGGQRQRLFIARELFRRPNLLILDEATSALDSDSERHIQDSIDALKGEITVVIIAHRLSTIRNVDYVYVLNRGRVTEEGPYTELRDQAGSQLGRLVAAQGV